MILHSALSDADLHRLIRQKVITFAGHRKSKIFGLLGCRSGKTMRRENRVFFGSAEEALNARYRPCRNCLGTGGVTDTAL